MRRGQNRFHFRGSLSHHIDTRGSWVYMNCVFGIMYPQLLSRASFSSLTSYFILLWFICHHYVYTFFDIWDMGSSFVAVLQFNIAGLMVLGNGPHHKVSNNTHNQFSQHRVNIKSFLKTLG